MKFLHRSRKGPESKSSIKQETVKFIIPKGFKGTVEDLFKMEFKGKYNEALNGWKTLLIPFQYPKIASQIEYMNSHKIIWLHIGMCYRRLKMYDQSLVAYGKAKELARLADDKEFLAEISNDIAVVYRHQGKVDKALGLLNEAINTAEAVKDFTLVVTIHDNIAMCYSDQGLLEKLYQRRKRPVLYWIIPFKSCFIYSIKNLRQSWRDVYQFGTI